MAIAPEDLLFIASERMTDLQADAGTQAGGGGYAGQAFVEDTENGVFPDVMPTDLVTGSLHLRLIYPAVLSLNDDVAANAGVGVAARPDDPLIDYGVFEAAALPLANGARRNSLDAALLLSEFIGPFVSDSHNGSGQLDGSDANVVTAYFDTGDGELGVDLNVGDKVAITLGGTKPQTWRTVTAVTPGGPGAGSFTYSGPPFGAPGLSGITIFRHAAPEFSVSAGMLTTGGVSATDTEIPVDRCDARVLPDGATLGTPGVPALGSSNGLVPAVKAGDKIFIQHPSTPETREVAAVDAVDYTGTLHLTAGLANAYPSGSKVCRLADLGSLGAAVTVAPFAQQTWTRVWQSTRIGGSITPRYSGEVGLVNAGAEDDRYAIVFKNATEFVLVSERRGQIAAGNTGTDFSPLNPLTNEPLFTLYASAWGLGWLANNVLRFDVGPAHRGAWVFRCVSPGADAAGDQGSLFMRVDVDA